LYLLCREQHVVAYQKSKGKDKTVQKLVPFTVGFQHLPEKGGMLNQPHRLLTFFEMFMLGDRIAFSIAANE
jgi:hypothetical protein